MDGAFILCILHGLPCSETFPSSQPFVFHQRGYLGHNLLSSLLSLTSFSSNLSPSWVPSVTDRQLCEKMKFLYEVLFEQNHCWLLLACFEVLLGVFQCFSKYVVIIFFFWISLSLLFWSESLLAMPNGTVPPQEPVGPGPGKEDAHWWWYEISAGRCPLLPQLQPCPVGAALRLVSWNCFPIMER